MSTFESKRFLIMTVDPVHVGTGGMRLGRVDNSIVREPGTRLPKIPGSALHGAIRQYAAYRYGKRQCAGQGGHCGKPTCPICYTFGFVKGDDASGQKAHSGVVSIGDAQILLFPVYSMAGPVWVTCPDVLRGIEVEAKEPIDAVRLPEKLASYEHLNLGWLMLPKDKSNGSFLLQIPKTATEDNNILSTITERAVLASNRLFSQVVNSNLEVRTSVSINPETGAAEEGALFTYEAIPRAAILWLQAIVDDYRGAFPSKHRLDEWKAILTGSDKSKQKDLLRKWQLWQERDGDGKLPNAIQKAKDWVDEELKRYDAESMPSPKKGWFKGNGNSQDSPANVVTAGLEWAEHLGIGGMGTRGFGRIRKIAEIELEENHE